MHLSVYNSLNKNVLYIETNLASEQSFHQENIYIFKVNFFHKRKTILIQLIFAQPGEITDNLHFFVSLYPRVNKLLKQ